MEKIIIGIDVNCIGTIGGSRTRCEFERFALWANRSMGRGTAMAIEQ